MTLEGRRIAVTGGAGFIGSHLVDRLSRHNSVVVVDDLSVGSWENLARTDWVRLVAADVVDLASIQEAVGWADVVFHLATRCLRSSIGDPQGSLAVNDLGTLNVLLAARDGRAEKVVYVSSSEVYGSAKRLPMDEDHPLAPRTPYAAGKLAGEAYAFSFLRTYGLPVVVVRPFNTYGPRSHLEGPSGELIPKFVHRALAGLPLYVFGDGRQTRDFTWVGDTVRGIELAAESDELVGSAVNLARGQEVSVLQVAELVQRLLRRQVQLVSLPERPGDVGRHLADVSRARQLLGFSAEVDFEEGLARYVDWVRSLPGRLQKRLEKEEVVNWQPVPSSD